MKAMLLAFVALCILARGVQMPEDGRLLTSALAGRGAVPSKATSLLQSKDEHVDADETSDDEISEEAQAEETEEAEEASATAAALQAEAKSQSHAAEEAAVDEKSEEASHVTGKSEVGGAGKKKRRAGLFSLVKAQASIFDMNKKMDKLRWNLETSQNKSGRCQYKRELYTRRVAELRAEREFRRKAKGKHLVMNETLAKARRAAGNHSTVGLWIITDEPFTREDEDREKHQRSITRMTAIVDNVTQLEAAAKKYTELEELYNARVAYYTDQMEELNATLQATRGLREEAKQNLRPKRRQRAKKQPLV
eukprot:CAMPEP_0171099890 /NCGR_PEP_ID=MMETSP0766_2-20121228/52634_1 /TAXON_ID=439317 /ORGANISM="Gambierdiscus australes, Strain CAWD 149" /LENGTH=307 /DNA_ID=CAMNT_0011559621 /DNA_START=72 /DNA_END=995 /DNA_ORIENTATION=+